MKRYVLCLLLLSAVSAHAQKPVMDHLSIYVTDLSKTVNFYQQVIGLDTIPEPFHDGKHAWFSIGAGLQFHVIAGAATASGEPKLRHLCFRTASVTDFAARLSKAGITYENLEGKTGTITRRVDGVQQLYLRDPDGYWIEVNDAK